MPVFHSWRIAMLRPVASSSVAVRARRSMECFADGDWEVVGSRSLSASAAVGKQARSTMIRSPGVSQV